MRILHTSDWHLGKRLESFSRFEEQKEVMAEICDIAENENIDVVIVSGDLFDTYNPPNEAVELFFKTLKKLSSKGRAVIAIAGNHDSPERIEAPDPLARECGIIFIGFPNTIVPCFETDSGVKIIRSEEGFIELQLPDINESIRILHTAYANEFRLRKYLGNENPEQELNDILSEKWNMLADKYCDDNGVNILISHLFFAAKGEKIPEEPEDEKPILHVGGAQMIYTGNIPPAIQYTGLGHLHRFQKIDESVVYCGSPLSYSFAEADQDKFVVITDIKAGEKASFHKIQLQKGKKLLRYKAENIENALKWLSENPDCLVELTVISDTYITANDRKQLNNAHQGIIGIIPEITNKELLTSSASNIDLSKNIEDLFSDFFEFEKGQKPNEEIINLFKEILSEEDDK